MLKTLYCSICIFLSVIFSTGKLYASDYFARALRIYSEGRYFEASIEFERVVFYESDINVIAVSKYYKSLCYKELGKTDKALNELNSINVRSLPDSLFTIVKYEHALCSYLNNDVKRALLDINDIRMKFGDKDEFMKVIPLNIICLNADRQWDSALSLWNYYLDNSNLTDSLAVKYKEEVKELYKKRFIPKYHSPEKAENLSRFFPGSGQIYSGAVLEGSVNFLINLSLLGYAFWEFYSRYYFTGYFVGLGLFNKFYTGGIHRAGIVAAEKNSDRIKEFNRKNSTLMLNIYNEKHK